LSPPFDDDAGVGEEDGNAADAEPDGKVRGLWFRPAAVGGRAAPEETPSEEVLPDPRIVGLPFSIALEEEEEIPKFTALEEEAMEEERFRDEDDNS
jgi:hypothetical protein